MNGGGGAPVLKPQIGAFDYPSYFGLPYMLRPYVHYEMGPPIYLSTHDEEEDIPYTIKEALKREKLARKADNRRRRKQK